MVKDSDTFSKWPVSGSISRDQSSHIFSKSSNVLGFNMVCSNVLECSRIMPVYWH